MAMKFLTNLNLLGNELQNAVIQVLATAPSNPKQGQIYYNSSDKLIHRYDGSGWGAVGVVYGQASSTGAVVTGLDDAGNVTTTNVTGLTLTGYTPVEGGYVTAGMTMQEAMSAMDTAIKNAVAGGGEVNQNAWSKILIKAQSAATTAVAGAAADVALSSDAKVDTLTIASGNKWVDINGSGKTVTMGHSLSGVSAGSAGAANSVPVVTVDAAGHVTAMSSATITPAAIGADAAGAAAAVRGADSDTSADITVYGARALASEAKNAADAAQAAADGKVASVGATANGGIAISGTATAPTVGIKLSTASGNAASLTADGLMVTVPAADTYSVVKDATSGNYAAVYHLTKNGTNVGEAINIPKDLFVESGRVVDNPTGQPEGKYIELKLQNQADPIYINVADLVDAYTAGDGIAIDDSNVISAKVDSANGLYMDSESGISMGLASTTNAGAMSAADFTKLGEIADGATANDITLNGATTANPSFYAPTTAGTKGQHLVSNGTGAPVWEDMPTRVMRTELTNEELTATGGVFTWTAFLNDFSNPVVQLYEVATNDMVMADVKVNGHALSIYISDTAGAGTLAAGTYRAVIIG